MNNWKTFRLLEICDFISRGVTPSYSEKGVVVINQKCVRDGKVSYEQSRYSDSEKKKISAEKYLKSFDILINSTGQGTLGRVGQVKVITTSTTVDSHVTIVRAKKEINPIFLGYVLKSKQPEIENLAEGSTGQTELSKHRLGEISISLPNLAIQNTVAEVLSAIDDKIELNVKINEDLESLAQTLFKQWFIDFEFPNNNGEPYQSSGGEMVESELGLIPVGWKIGILSDLVDFSNGNAFKSTELLKDDIGDCYHVFKMGHIKKGGGLNPDGTKSYFEKLKTSKLERFILKSGDLLMCMTDMKGNVALLGHTALMNEDNKYIVNQRVGLLRSSNEIGIDYPYLYILTNSNDFIENLRSRANSGVQVNLSTSEIKSSSLLLPLKEINIAFDTLVKPFFESIFNITKENQELAKLRDLLLPKLISGELEVSELMTENT